MSSFQRQNLYGIGIGSTNGNGYYPVFRSRAPSTTDTNYSVGTPWIWANNGGWLLIGFSSAGGVLTANWVQTTSASGDILAINGTANQITAVTAAGATTLSTPATFIAPGSIASTTTITSGTGITSTTGNITATNGNLVLSTAGNKLVIATGANASVGTTAAMSTGAVTITSTAITTSSIILYSRKTLGTVGGNVSITAQTTGSATLTSDAGTETSTFNYQIIN